MKYRENVIKGLNIFYNSIADIKHDVKNSWHINLDNDIDIFFIESCPNYKPNIKLNVIVKPSAMTVIKYNKKTKLIIECSIYIDNTPLKVFNPTLNFQPHWITDDLYLFSEKTDYIALSAELETNTYAIENKKTQELLLIDALLPNSLEAVDLLTNQGKKVVGVLCSHYHTITIAQLENLEKYQKKYPNVPIFLHSNDVDNKLVQKNTPKNFKYANPENNLLLQKFGIETWIFPGHTDNHLMIYWKNHGGVLFIGDSGVGPRLIDKSSSYVRPPYNFSNNDELLRENWIKFLDSDFNDKKIRNICPFHGKILWNEDKNIIKTHLNGLISENITPSISEDEYFKEEH
jgi:glyoxylase-like metal-dependent hydrolase (beta-lactamase superfamily II)